MVSRDKSNFRITLWGPQDVQPVSWRFWEIALADDYYVPDVAVDPPELIEIPEEFYLRELHDLDINDTEAMKAFFEDFGMMLFGDFSYAHETRPYLRPPFKTPGRASRYIWETPLLGDYAALRLWEAGVVEDFLTRFDEIYENEPFPAELIDEQKVAIAWIRDLARLWIQFREDGLEEPPDRWESGPFGIKKPRTKEACIEALTSGITAALQPMTRYLFMTFGEVLTPDEMETPPRAEPWKQPFTYPQPPVYSLIVYQLYEHMTENAEYRTCQNETCRRLFVRQVNGAGEKGRSRTEGLLYCSKRCGQVQAQRDYRKRKKDAGTKGDR